MPSVRRRPYHHCGPGNFVYDSPSSNPIDEACRQHDIAYGKQGFKSYFTYNDADAAFTDTLDNLPETTSQIGRARLYSNIFKLKKKVTFSSQKETGMAKRGTRTRSGSRSRSRTPTRNTRARVVPPTPRTPARGRSRSRSNTRRHRVGRAIPLRAARRSVRRAIQSASGNRITRSAANMHLKNGVTFVGEVGDVKTSPYCLYLGHSTYKPAQFQLSFFRAVIKNLLIKANKLNPNWNGYPLRGATDDTIYVAWKGNADKDTPISEYIYGWNAVTTSQEQAAQALWNYFKDDSTQLQFLEFQHRPSGTVQYGAVSFYVDYGYVDVYCKSTFTMQNRTIDEADDDSVLNIDRVPLIGKHYTGNGAGTKYITTPQVRNNALEGQTVPFLGDAADGVIWVDPENMDRIPVGLGPKGLGGLREPPPAKHFQGCKKSSAVHLEPGQMLTDTLYLKKTMKIQDFVNACWTKPFVTAGDIQKLDNWGSFRQSSLGKWSFFAMEKKLAAKIVSSPSDIKLAFQVDTKISVVLRPKRSTYTTPVVAVGYIGPPLLAPSA